MMTEDQIYAQTAKLDKDYELVAKYFLNEDKQIVLKDSCPGKCRFCGRRSPEVSFEKKAHAISEMFGNKWITSEYECDECNERFSKYEAQYSQFMGAYHTFMQCFGKKGVPSFQFPKGIVRSDQGNIDIKVQELNAPFRIDEANKTLTLDMERTYIPVDVWRALTKMALTILPEKYLPELQPAFEWLQMDAGSFKLLKYPVIIKTYPLNFPFITTFLFRRKDESQSNVPAYVFILTYGGIFIQMPVTGCLRDDSLQGECQLPIMPNPLDEYKDPIKTETIYFNSVEKVAKEPFSMAFKYSSCVEKDPSSPKECK